ncbi:hypothetical protein EVJ58_g7045 [Rhodofomes roseus]|uniref:Ig-like domain-containing protein n=1 Tax=Rhodofomes roseus TaxID=34475 RepID=A0A4Y9Y4W5_9APHY|nr:hypothetical protein EVJ58_g7045 [Rhodofomes roseus]
MVLINVKHLSKDLPMIPGRPHELEDSPPAYEPVASTTYDPYIQHVASEPTQLVQKPDTHSSAESAPADVDRKPEDTAPPSTQSLPVPGPSRGQPSSESNVSVPLPQPPPIRPARSELSLSYPSSTKRRPHARRRASGSDYRSSRPHSMLRLSSALSDKSKERTASKSPSGTVTPLAASEIMSGFLRDLLTRQLVVEQSAEVVLKGCTDACREYGLSLAALLQEPIVEGHTPIYWAVVKCGPGPQTSFIHELLSAFLTCAAPLTEATLSDIRHACLENPIQELFQWIRRLPAITPLIGAAEVLFSGEVPEDDVVVEELSGDKDMFVGHFRILMFQKRMRVLKHVDIEFIARGRLWCLKVYVATAEDARKMRHGIRPGAWVVTLSLLEGSQPTWVDSGFIVCNNDGTATQIEGNHANWLRLKHNHQLTAPPHSVSASSFFKDAFAVDCLSSGSPYVQSDGSLSIRLEASLRKEDTGCIIC